MAVKRYSLFLYAALAVGFFATYMVYRTLERAKVGTQVATTKVVVASRDISEGELIDRVALATADWPTATVPAGAYGNPDSVAGRVARVNVFKGEAFVPGRLAPREPRQGSSTKICRAAGP
ncbi:MAG: Flp pilus assembly protein CpaB [Gemmatimonadaceae bacterium]